MPFVKRLSLIFNRQTLRERHDRQIVSQFFNINHKNTPFHLHITTKAAGEQKKGAFTTKIIIFRSLRKYSEDDFNTFAAAMHDVPGAKANKRTLTIEANGHRVEFRNGSPYDPKNAGLRADIAIPHYDYITAGSEYEKDPRFRNCSFTRVLEIMKGIVKP